MFKLFIFLLLLASNIVFYQNNTKKENCLPEKCYVHIERREKYNILICKGFDSLKEIEINCSYPFSLKSFIIYPSKKIILDSSINWNNFFINYTFGKQFIQFM